MIEHCQKRNLINDLETINESQNVPSMIESNKSANDSNKMKYSLNSTCSTTIEKEIQKIEAQISNNMSENEIKGKENLINQTNIINLPLKQGNQIKLPFNQESKTFSEKKRDHEFLISLALYKNCNVEGNDKSYGAVTQ